MPWNATARREYRRTLHDSGLLPFLALHFEPRFDGVIGIVPEAVSEGIEACPEPRLCEVSM